MPFDDWPVSPNLSGHLLFAVTLPGASVTRAGNTCREGDAVVPKFITIGYGDQQGYLRTPLGIRKAAHQHDVELQARGALMGVAGAAVQVRNPENAGLQTQDGPYLSSLLPVAGFALIEASSLDEAVQLVAQSPCAVAHGVVEVWHLQEP